MYEVLLTTSEVTVPLPKVYVFSNFFFSEIQEKVAIYWEYLSFKKHSSLYVNSSLNYKEIMPRMLMRFIPSLMLTTALSV